MKKSSKNFNYIPGVEAPTPVPAHDVGIMLAETSSYIQASEARTRYKVSGKGFTVAVLDTGLRTTHVDFAGKVVAQVNFTKDNGGNPNDATDGNGHGTNVGGIIVANALNTGIAPGANIIPVKVLPNGHGGSFDDIYKGLKWVFDNRATYNISVVNLSLGNNINEKSDTPYETHPVKQVIRDLNHAGVAVVIAAGNGYFEHNSEPGMSFPGIIRECISVGAVYDAVEGPFHYKFGASARSSTAGQITPFSQRLPKDISGDCFTDIFAPGAPITSSGATGDRDFSTQHGTSQAAPVTAGVICLMQELYRNIFRALPDSSGFPAFPSIEMLSTWLQNGGIPIFDGDNEDDNVKHTNAWYHAVNAYQALRQVRKYFVREMAFDDEEKLP